MSELTNDQRSKVLQSHMFVVRKRTGETKARVVAGGNLQRGHMTKEESSSPTVRGSGGKMTNFSNESYDQSEYPNLLIYTPI